ncbi:hypothetical protein CRENBAI_025699 [Crenichthys baileyi]|uniref:Uncharacterized protein n=1 Tax=Crenichthys baileyi TaxID=28760 RepID=A0AAV9SN41_9TELE
MKPAEIRISLQRLLQHRDPTMAPTSRSGMINSEEHLSPNDKVGHFLSKDKLKTQSQRRLLNPFNKLQTFFAKNLKEADLSSLCPVSSISKSRRPVNSARRQW